MLILRPRVSDAEIVERQTTGSLIAWTGICDNVGYEWSLDLPAGEAYGCEVIDQRFQSLTLTGQWLAVKIFSDTNCQNLVSIIDVENPPLGEPDCYLVEGNGGGSWNYSP